MDLATCRREKERFRIVAPEDVGQPSYEVFLEQASLLQQHGPMSDNSAFERLRKLYLDSARHHIMAEHWASFAAATKACHPYKVKAERVRVPERRDSVGSCDDAYDVAIRNALDVRHGGTSIHNLRNLKGHLCIWDGNLFFAHAMAMSCECQSNCFQDRTSCIYHKEAVPVLLMRKVGSMSDYPDQKVATSEDRLSMLYSLGLHSTFLKGKTLISSMQSDAPNARNDDLLDAICNPGLQQVCRDSKGEGDATLFNNKQDIELRPEQRRVISELNKKLELIQGPPGTGKTTITRAIVRDYLPHSYDDDVARDDVILLLAVQNKPINLLVSGFDPYIENDTSTSSVRMFVVGGASNPKIGADASRYTFHGLINQNKEYINQKKTYEQVSDEYKRLLLTNPTTAEAEQELSRKRADKKEQLELLKKELKEICERISDEIRCSARIVFSTTTELFKIAMHPMLEKLRIRIKTVIIDEAGIVPEYDAAMLASLPFVERIICIGDTQQLPPFSNVKNRPDGFMQRIENQRGSSNQRMLTRQFRMSQFICKLVSDAFYNGQLIMDIEESERQKSEFVAGRGVWRGGIHWLDYSASAPTHMLQEVKDIDRRISTILIARVPHGCTDPHLVVGNCEETMNGGRANATEIAHILRGLEFLANQHVFDEGPGSKSVAILSWYKLHISVIEASIARPSKHKEPLAAKLLAAKDAGHLRIQTVDSFQGAEADIIILSGVRSNKKEHVGFLASAAGKNRICVALSRAKEALIIVGDRTTLQPQIAFELLWKEDQPNEKYGLSPMTSIADLYLRDVNSISAQQQQEALAKDLVA